MSRPRRRRPPLALAVALAAVLALCACSGGTPSGQARSAADRQSGTSTPGAPSSSGGTSTSGGAATPAPRRPARYAFPVQPAASCDVHYGHFHHDYPATDIFSKKGCRFVAPTDGKVSEISRDDVWDGATDRGADRGGRSVAMVGDDGVRYYGSHLERVAGGLRPGTRVSAGQLLGLIDNSGDARFVPTHLHFGISWPTRDGAWWVRRGMVAPWRFLDSWRAGGDRSPAAAVRAALAEAGRPVPPCQSGC